jgi:hypothetical protein
LSELDFAYSVFGLSLRVNRSIPGLKPAGSTSQSPDVQIHLGFSPRVESQGSTSQEVLTFTSSILSESGEPTLRIWQIMGGAFLRLDYSDGVQFWLEREGKAIWARWSDSSSLEDAATYLLGPVLGLALRLRGVTCLHASAVSFGNRAVAFAGTEGAGKSTTAAALAQRGHRVISDDIVALVESDGAFFVLPAYPYLCLWPDSVNMLYGTEKMLPAFSRNWDKRQLSLAENRLGFEEQPQPLGAIFLLGERTTDEAAPFVETVAPKDGLLSLVADTYATNLLDRDMRAREFELLGRMLGVVPVWRLRPNENASRIDGLCDVISRACSDLLVWRSRVSG